MRKSNRRGFTLIEMMIVVLVIAILALIVGLAVRNAGDRSKHSRYIADTAAITNAAIMYRNDTGLWPQATNAVVTDPGVENWQGPYLSRTTVPECPWCTTPYEIVIDEAESGEDPEVVGTGEASCPNCTKTPADGGLWSYHTAPTGG